MSWARLDDGFWEHPKVQALLDMGPRGLEAIGAYVLSLSYCNRQHRPGLTVWEIAMLTRRGKDDAAELAEILCSAPEDFERGLFLRSNAKQTRSKAEAADEFASDLLQSKREANAKQSRSKVEAYVINSFKEYRGKNPARVAAGSQGGVKSGEKRRSKTKDEAKQGPSDVEARSKQTRSKREANAKQSRTSQSQSQSQSQERESKKTRPVKVTNGSAPPTTESSSFSLDYQKILDHHAKVYPDVPSWGREPHKDRMAVSEAFARGMSVEDVCHALTGSKSDEFTQRKKLIRLWQILGSSKLLQYIADGKPGGGSTPETKEASPWDDPDIVAILAVVEEVGWNKPRIDEARRLIELGNGPPVDTIRRINAGWRKCKDLDAFKAFRCWPDTIRFMEGHELPFKIPKEVAA